MGKIAQVIGTRPQYIKLIDIPGSIIIDTGQHYDDELNYDKPKATYQLKWKSIKEMISELDWLISDPFCERYDGSIDKVIVYGDTYSTLVGAYAAKRCGRKLYHVEAGIRTGVNTLEERIRKRVDKVADVLFCPTRSSYQHMKSLYPNKKVYFVGDLMYEKFLKSRTKSHFSILTLHRRENLPDLQEILDELPNEVMLFYAHPHTQKYIKDNNIKIPELVYVQKPISNRELLMQLPYCKQVITDSGGLIREAYWSGCPVRFIGTNPWPEVTEFGYGDTSLLIKEILKNE